MYMSDDAPIWSQDLVFRKKLATLFYLSQLLASRVFHIPYRSLIRGEQIEHAKNGESSSNEGYYQQTNSGWCCHDVGDEPEYCDKQTSNK